MYNAERSIVQALDSIRNQTFHSKFEIIIINDGSTDLSQSLVEKYQSKHPELEIILIRQKNQGVSIARNRGLEIAKGNWIALLDADDEWNPDKTEKQMKILLNKSFSIDLLGTLRNNNPILWPYKPDANNLAKVTFKKLLIRNELQPSTVIFNRKILKNTGLFEITQSHAEDVDYWLRASQYNQLSILCESLILAGKGKLSFGVEGLSADLKSMRNGFINNLKRLYQANRISKTQLWGYSIFYRLKYLVLLLRISLRK